VHMRAKAVETHAIGSATERAAMRAFARAMASARAYRRAVKLARFGAGVLARTGLRPGPVGAWTRYRELPAIARETFKEWWTKNR
jgi:L-lactate dehydrogenase complex protein LldF